MIRPIRKGFTFVKNASERMSGVYSFLYSFMQIFRDTSKPLLHGMAFEIPLLRDASHFKIIIHYVIGSQQGK